MIITTLKSRSVKKQVTTMELLHRIQVIRKNTGEMVTLYAHIHVWILSK